MYSRAFRHNKLLNSKKKHNHQITYITIRSLDRNYVRCGKKEYFILVILQKYISLSLDRLRGRKAPNKRRSRHQKKEASGNTADAATRRLTATRRYTTNKTMQ